MIWRTHEEREEWADDHGYQQYRCPGCHKLYYSDSGPIGNCPCGWMPEPIMCDGCDDIPVKNAGEFCEDCKAQNDLNELESPMSGRHGRPTS